MSDVGVCDTTTLRSLPSLLDQLASTPFAQLSRIDTQSVLSQLRAYESLLDSSPAPPHMTEEPCTAEALARTSVAPASCSPHRESIVCSLSLEQQDTLMRVLYASMAPAGCGFGDAADKEDRRAAYAWYAVVVRVAGLGAVVRTLTSR